MQGLKITLALLLISSAGHAQGPGGVAPDNRMLIPVTKSERNLVLSEMREFLHGLHGIQIALSGQDARGIALTARPLGPMLERMPVTLREKFPEEFVQLAIAQNEAFQALARMAENKSGVGPMLEQTAEILTYCSGCHDTYRFDLVAPAKTGGSRVSGGR